MIGVQYVSDEMLRNVYLMALNLWQVNGKGILTHIKITLPFPYHCLARTVRVAHGVLNVVLNLVLELECL